MTETKVITIQTKHFGEMEIPEDQVVNFPQGILAFEEYRNYVLVAKGEQPVFHWLQSLEDPNIAFAVMDPRDILPGYQPAVMKADVEALFGENDDFSVWCILTIPKNKPEEMTINLQGPLLISRQKRVGGQFISNDESHQVRMLVMELVEAGELA